MSVKSKHSGSRKSGKKEKRKKESDEEFESSEEELDLTKECHPIGYYINDRAEMINQMFSVIKGNKLKAMLPPCLKDCDIDQLKLQCLDQLLGMSEKRITCILEGETLETSSESEVAESDECDSDEKNLTNSSSSSTRSHGSHEHGYTNNVNHRHKKRKGESISDAKPGKATKIESENAQPEQGKTLLEILELEMRARAIRALLKQSGNELKPEETDADKNGVEEISGEIVDLTECEEEENPIVGKKDNPPESEIDLKVSTFDEKVEKTKKEKTNTSQEDEKSKRLQAELELRNKLFKKKIYRTRQQRMDNEEESKNVEKDNNEHEKEKEQNNASEIAGKDVMIKEQPNNSEEIAIEGPEEGEIGTSEDEYPVEIKRKPQEERSVPEPKIPNEPGYPDSDDFSTKIDRDAERVTAIDNGAFVNNCNVENTMSVNSSENEEKPSGSNEEQQIVVAGKDSEVKNQEDSCSENQKKESESEKEKEDLDEFKDIEEGTSWRDRWLQKGVVQKLVKSSKIYAKVKKRIAEKTHRAKEEHCGSLESNLDSNSNSKQEVIEGSIEEYERLLRKTQEPGKEEHLGEGDKSHHTTEGVRSSLDEKT